MDFTRTEPQFKAAGTRPYMFIVPADFSPEEFLPPQLRLGADDARYLVDSVIRKSACGDVDEQGYAHLHSDVLVRTMAKRTRPGIIKALREQGVETTPHSAGRFSRGYRLAEGLLGQNPARRACRDLRLLSRIQRERERLDHEERGKRLPIHDKLAAIQRCLSVTPAATTILDTLPPVARFCQSVLVENIRRGDYRFHVSNYGRCFNALTGIKRLLRPAVRIAGCPMGSLDVCCAQPALLALLMAIADPTLGLLSVPTYCLAGAARDSLAPLLPASLPRCRVCRREFHRFAELVCGGVFNDWLVSTTGMTKAAAKRRFLVDVLAKRPVYPPSEIEIGFKSCFPTVFAFIKAVNNADYRALIRLLQRLEAWLVIEQVAPRLIDKIPFVTLHDAVFSRLTDVPIVEAAFHETFDAIGFKLALKPESWASNQTALSD